MLQVRPGPIPVSGANFASGESIKLFITGDEETVVRGVTAKTDGSFALRLPAMRVAVDIVRVRALGSKGHLALWVAKTAHTQAPGYGGFTRLPTG